MYMCVWERERERKVGYRIYILVEGREELEDFGVRVVI